MSKSTSVVISKDKIFLWNASQIKFEEVCTWTNKTLLEQLKILKQKNGLSKVQIFLSDDISFVLSFVMEPVKDSNERHEKISSKIAERIPEYFENIVWDYKVIDSDDKVIVQVAAIERELITQIQNNFVEAKIDVSLIEPLSCALAKNIEANDHSKIVAFTSTIENILFLVYKSAVFVVDVINIDQISDNIKKFVDYTGAKYSDFKTDILVVSDSQKIIQSNIESIVKEYGIKIQIKKDALIELSGDHFVEQSHKNPDRLDLVESDALAKPSLFSKLKGVILKSRLSYKTNKNSKAMKIVMIVFVIILLLACAVTIFSYLKGKDQKPVKQESQVEVNTTPSAVEIPSIEDNQTDMNESNGEEAVETVAVDELKLADFNGYKLQILNGSGIKGEADKLRALLNDLKFTEIAIGNADKTNYEDTVVSYKSIKLVSNSNLLDSRMTKYKIDHVDKLLSSENPYDIVIIVGRARLDDKENSLEDATKTQTSPTDSSGIAPLQ